MEPQTPLSVNWKFSEIDKKKMPYDKYIEHNIMSQKTGMNILVYGDLNIAGQLTSIFRSINKHTIHKARCLIVQDDYLQYDKDIILIDQHQQQIVTDFSRIQELVAQTDFFHVGRRAVNLPGINFDKILNEGNCLVQYFGSYLRMNYERLFLWHMKTNISALVGYGWVLAYPLPRRFYHIEQFFDPSEFKRVPKLNLEDPIRVAHAPTNRSIKGTDKFLAIMDKLCKEFNVEVDLIEGVSNKECLERKAQCHITFDEMGTPTFGLNTRESMAMGHVCLSSVNPHVLSYLPDLPVVRITPESLEKILRYLLSNVELINLIGDRSYEFVRKTYNTPLNVTKLAHLYEGIKSGFFHTNPGLPMGFDIGEKK